MAPLMGMEYSTIACGWASSGAVGVDVLSTPDGTQFTRISYDLKSQQLLVDQRACCGAPPGNGVVQSAPLTLEQGEGVELAVFVDGYMIEAFMNNRTVITALVAPNATAAPPADRRSSIHNTSPVKCDATSWQLAL